MSDARTGAGAELAILAKAPIPGYAKTRLIPRLGPEGAAELHAVLVERTLRTALASGFARVALWCAPSRDAAFFRGLPGGVALRDQATGDLGARMRTAFEAHLREAGSVVLVGTDCPELGVGHLRRLAAALAAGADAAILPALDGGYAALGLRRVAPSIFEGVRWGTAEVLAATRERLRRLGFATRELPPLRDVDVPADLDWLRTAGLLDERERARLAAYLSL